MVAEEEDGDDEAQLEEVGQEEMAAAMIAKNNKGTSFEIELYTVSV